MRLLVSAILITGTSAPLFTEAGVPFNGLKGEALIRAIGENCRPAATVGTDRISGTYFDPFNGRTIEIRSGSLPEDYEWGCMIPAEWWENGDETARAAAGSDLHNLMPLDGDVRANRGQLPPGDVASPVFSNGFWSAGKTTVAGIESSWFSPPAALRGRYARTCFYMAAVHHVDSWSLQGGFTMMDSRAYPGLSAYAIDLLLGWHRANPADGAEIEANSRVAALQGNSNPFVDYPDLAEHLWGNRKDTAFVIEDEPQPLRAVYTLDDVRVDLWSPHVPADALWAVDGRTVTDSFVSTVSLGLGDHILTYSSPSTGESGRVMIKIQEK